MSKDELQISKRVKRTALLLSGGVLGGDELEKLFVGFANVLESDVERRCGKRALASEHASRAKASARIEATNRGCAGAG